MNFYLDVLKKYAVFDGRAGRQEFWMFVLINWIIMIGLTVIETVVGGPGLLGTLYSLAVLIPSLAVGARRLHDTDRSGWWQLIGLTVIGVIVLIVFFAMAGQAGANQHGAPPK
jgi:uncharacterized membrane protein YhaH (DUF805 family)